MEPTTEQDSKEQLLKDCGAIIKHSVKLGGGRTPLDMSKFSTELYILMDRVEAAFDHLTSQGIGTGDVKHQQTRLKHRVDDERWSEGIVFPSAGLSHWKKLHQ